jgi:hypothetical protein
MISSTAKENDKDNEWFGSFQARNVGSRAPASDLADRKVVVRLG